MVKKILFATDLGTYAAFGLMYLEALANQFDADVHILHVVPPIEDFAAAVLKSRCSEQVKQEVLQTQHVKGLLETLREQVFEVLVHDPSAQAEFLRRIKDILVLSGNPAAVTLKEAERLQVDMIIIGSHTESAIDTRLLGSVATKILQLAKVPVLLVPMVNSLQKPADLGHCFREA